MTHDRRGYWRGCRCDVCRAGHAAYELARPGRGVYTPSDDWVVEDRRHGTLATYKAGCRCGNCRTANTRYVADSRAC